MEDMITVPRETLQAAHDALEEIEDCFEFSSPTWLLHQQLSVLLDPASAGFPTAKPGNIWLDGGSAAHEARGQD